MAQLDTMQEVLNQLLHNQTRVALPTELGMLTLVSIIIALVTFVVAIFIVYRIYHRSKDSWDRFWNNRKRHLTRSFVAVWLMGFCVYLVGTSIVADGSTLGQTFGALLCQMPMAAVHAFEMFALQSDISAIHGMFHSSLLFMFFFSLAHFLAACVSTLFIIKYFGYNLIAKFKLWYATLMRRGIDELYVFWGMNEATYTLAKDIQWTYKVGKKTGSYEIVVINTAEDDEDMTGKEHTAMERLFSFFSLKKEELNQYKELDCLSVNVFDRLAKVKITDAEAIDILEDQMDLHSFTSLIRKTNERVHVFLLSSDEDENIIGTSNLCRDTTIRSFAVSPRSVSIYCHARFDSVNRVIEDKFSNDTIHVKVIDSSLGCINILRSTPEFHPVRYIDIDKDDNIGTVKGGFSSLVLGFGETGRDAVRYLYEYGAFVSNESAKDDDAPEMSPDERQAHAVYRSPFRCYVVDKDADHQKGQFFALAPAVEDKVEMWNTDVLSQDFYEELEKICHELNYIVVAFGDDEQNINVAIRIFNFIRMKRPAHLLKNFVIFVRCRNTEKGKHFQHVADHYNEKSIDGQKQEYIRIFGTVKQLYTYEQIVENDFVKEGCLYNELYCKASGKDGAKDKWASRHSILLKAQTLDSLSELRRKESQDIANAYHALTKLYILHEATLDANGQIRPELKNIRDCLDNYRTVPEFHERKMNEDKTKRLGVIKAETVFSEQEQLLMRNLARLEHIRWNAAHEVLGYRSYMDGDGSGTLVKDEYIAIGKTCRDGRHCCNERFKLHNCLVDWHRLDEEMNHDNNTWHPDYKFYDYTVITATLMLNNKRGKV